MSTYTFVMALFLLAFLGGAVRSAASWLALTAAGPLLITEVYYDTPGVDVEEEWLEIANLGTTAIDISRYQIGDEETAGGREGMMRFPHGAAIQPGQVVVIAQTATGFRALFGKNPDYEFQDSDPAVPDMRHYFPWSSGEIALANDGDEVLLLNDRGVIIDAINYGNSVTYFAPSISGVLTGQSLERVPADCDTDSAADWQPRTTPTPGELFFEGECRAPVNPAELEALPPIGEIQGRDVVSPYINQIVSFRGVVTGVYEDRNTRGVTYYTLFVQDLPGYEDGDPATSDGIAVFLGRERPEYAMGDQVRVTGQVTEFFGFTEIDYRGLQILVEASDAPLPEPVAIDPPADNIAQAAYFEALEAMRATLAGAARVVGPTYSGCGFAVVGADTGITRVLRRRQDDPVGHVVPVLHISDVDCAGFPNVKSGDLVEGITGPLIYHFEQFKIVQQAPAALVVTAVPTPTLPAPLTLAAGQFSVTTFNLENHFDAIDDTGDSAEPKPALAAIAVRQTKLAYAIGHILGCPTLIGVQEVEKETLLLALAAELAGACGFTYAVAHRDSPDSRGIDVALLSDPRRVSVGEGRLRQACTELRTGIVDPGVTCPPGQQPLFSRPPLQVGVHVDGYRYILYINHFKSKLGGERETAPQRLAQARHINALVAEQLDGDEAARLIVLGDFNDYDQSLPLLAMTAGDGRLTNVLAQAPEMERYSFIFGGASQLIDGILVSPALLQAVVAVTILHVNADYPESLHIDGSPAALPYRATDHDLPLLVLALPLAPQAIVEEIPAMATAEAETVVENVSPGTTPERHAWLFWLAGAAVVVMTVAARLFYRRS